METVDDGDLHNDYLRFSGLGRDCRGEVQERACQWRALFEPDAFSDYGTLIEGTILGQVSSSREKLLDFVADWRHYVGPQPVRLIARFYPALHPPTYLRSNGVKGDPSTRTELNWRRHRGSWLCAVPHRSTFLCEPGR